MPYSVTDAYSAALRFVRIDKGCSVVDKDGDAAFVTFECKEDGHVKRGSVEIFRSGPGVRLQISLGDDPRYVELRWLELLERKLREERGTPPPVTPAKKPAPDGGT